MALKAETLSSRIAKAEARLLTHDAKIERAAKRLADVRSAREALAYDLKHLRGTRVKSAPASTEASA